MTPAHANREVSLWERLFGRQLVGVNCVSQLEERAVSLPAEFVAGSHTLEVSFGLDWPWLLPRFWPPLVSVRVTDENGNLIAPTTEPMLAMRRRHTDVTFVLSSEPPWPRRLCVTVSRAQDGHALERFELCPIDLPSVAREVELLCFETYALQSQQQILTRRFHEQVEQIQFGLQLRLANPNHASFLRQSSAALVLQLESETAAPAQRWRLPACFERGALRWAMQLGAAANLFSGGPGKYRLTVTVGAHPLGELRLDFVPLELLRQYAQARLVQESTFVPAEFSAINHRGVTEPLQVVAEDFRSIDVKVIMECPLPDPLLPELDLPLYLQLTKDARAIQTEQIAITLHSGRNTLQATLRLQASCFAAGTGAYRLELTLCERSLADFTFEHQTRQQLNEARAEAILQSLELTHPRLFVLRDGARVETDHAFATDEAIIPKFTITGQGFDDDVPGIRWRVGLRLVRVDSGTVTKAERLLTARAGANTHEVGRLRPHPERNELAPGWYAYQFWKQETLLTEFRFRILAVAEIAPYTETLVRASLRVESARLFVVACGSHYETSEIPDSTEFIVPEFTLRSSGYNRFLPRWSTELRLALETPAGVQQDWGKLPVLLQAEPLSVNNIQIRLAGTAPSQQPGRYRLLISVAGRELACLPFQVLTEAEVHARIQVTDLTVVTIAKSKQQNTNPATILAGETSSLGITGALTVGLLAPGQATAVTFEIYLDDVCVAQQSAAIALAQRQHAFRLRPVALTSLLPHRVVGTKQLIIAVRVAGQIGRRQAMTLICHERITNFEGQLNVDPSVVSHKRLELFSLCFAHSWTGAPRLDLLKRLPAPMQFFHNRIHGRGPDKRFWIGIPRGQKLLNRLLEIGHTDKDPSPNPFSSQFAKPAFDQI
jgi:hypothetical protein